METFTIESSGLMSSRLVGGTALWMLISLMAIWKAQVVRERHKVERGLGIGGVGSFDGMRSNARAAATCAALAAANGRFRVAHALSVMATAASAAGLAAHSCYLACKIAL